MCGICGIIKFNNTAAEPDKIYKMMHLMKHRGPDDEGIFIEGNVGFGFVRLSILDLSSAGYQPMWDESHRYVIIHNGEVYNYVEIREELKKKGYIFKSNTDTEVILKCYIEWGEECLHKFNGMWAFVIYDRNKKKLFCARDRFGIKPFYYFLDDERFIFSSEIPPILAILKNKLTANNQVIFDYLVFNRTDQTEQTFFNEINKLQHAHTLTISLNNELSKPVVKQWYDLRNTVKNTEGFRNPGEYREIFSSAVGLRLRSDVPVGVCLSGGLDSSSIVSVLLNDHKFKDVNTFSAVYGKGKRGDESDFIHEFDGIIRNMHFTYPDSESLYNDIDRFITAHGEPIPSTAPYAQFKVMELAKDYVVVTLDGQGADEELAGYHYFFGFLLKDLFKSGRIVTLLAESSHYVVNHKSSYGLKTFLYYMLPQSLKTSSRVGERGYISVDFVDVYSGNNSIAGDLYNSTTLNDALLDHFEYKLEHLLKWEDRNSMWFSLESRVPFLDYRLVEKTIASRADMKIKNGTTKYILREAMNGTLPEKIKNRKDKIGFMTPEDEWFRHDKLKTLINDILKSDTLKNRYIVNPIKAKRLYQEHLDKKIQISKDIWKWINLELWFRKFIDR
jgi:asparagine synthase (glutamine-hydrolysing)